jgi:Rad3-related DNA helicase
MTWSLYEKDKFLKPKTFSNGKSQEDVVNEVLDAIKNKEKIIFIHGVCGSGKSAIALNIARKLGKTSIIVPGKNLQIQYKKDYEEKKHVLKENILGNVDIPIYPKLKDIINKKEKLKISVITGRNNHKCQFLEDSKKVLPKIVKEVNLKLHDIFDSKRHNLQQTTGNDISADNKNIPCKIEIKEKNWQKLKEYLRKNKNIDHTKFQEINDIKRVSLASICPYWSPVLPKKYELKNFQDSRKREYLGLKNMKFIFHEGKKGCKFYEQFISYIDSDVIVFNSSKYNLELALDRKPLTEIEIIDECDEFLDNYSNQKSINIDRIQNSLIRIISDNETILSTINELHEILKQIKQNKRVRKAIFSDEILPLKETGIYDLLKIFLDSELFEEIDDENYLFEIKGIAKIFEDLTDEAYITFNKNDNGLIASIVTTNLEKKFKELVEKNKIVVLMSGTLHSQNVLKNIFGLNNFKIIEAETSQQGKIEIKKTGKEIDCKYSNFSSGKYNRGDYLKALKSCVDLAKKPALVHVNAFLDLPSEEEIKSFDLKNMVSREELIRMQSEDKTGKLIEDFKNKKTNILFSTRASRGIDFPGEECKSIIFTKYPNPNVQDAFWKILMKTKPEFYWDFYKDKAKREVWQKVYRGLRFQEDHIYLLSPDTRVLEAFETH